jgi:hypothetical protein
MHGDLAEGTLTHGRVWGLKVSAFCRTFNAMLATTTYVKFYLKSIAEYPKELSFFCNE